MSRRGLFYTDAARRLVSLNSSLFPSAAIVRGGMVSEPCFGSSAPATIDDTRSKETVDKLKQTNAVFLKLYFFEKYRAVLFFSLKTFSNLSLFPSHLIILIFLQNMSVPKIETDKFDGKSDFVMWRRKMKVVLVQNKIVPAICSPEEYPESWKDEILSEKLGDAHKNHMKNKCFKQIKDEKQRKHGKGSNKTYDFDSDESRKEERDREREETEGVAPVIVLWLRSRFEGSDHLVTHRRCLDVACSTQPLLGVMSLSARHCSRRRPLSAVVPWSFIFLLI
ncbi:hypothetical protein M9H77_06710 [Catharanthus roseus]|uniref:Uncharacterized protein n=1 Tax=Catharanthus roseus TaxID=4058 RepID=A0ACC0BSW1_CATRO|nr:hypothetical protein M9H77_06710 [Catharanthus roseus]